MYQRSNLLISQFRSCDSETLDRLHKTYCMHMYGCELWNLSCSYINGYKVAWRKIKRRIWNISPRTHNNLVSNVTDNIDTLIETRMVRFIFNSINHSNNTCKNILRVKLLSVNQGRQTGGVGGGVSTPPEFWMGGLNTCQPPLILGKNFLGGVGSP